MLKIGLIGQVSAGKSSLLNALAGCFISNISLRRETFKPEIYQFSKKGSARNYINILQGLDQRHKNNEKMRETINTIKTESLTTPNIIADDKTILPSYHSFDFMLIDFPGINDADDTDGKFFKCFESNIDLLDIVIYITSAETAFTLTSELEIFKKIQNLIKVKNDNGIYTDLIICVNKYDDNDSELEKIYEDISKKTQMNKDQIFRISSHKMFMNICITNNLQYRLPDCIKQEFKKICKNSEVSINQSIDSTYIDFSKIKYHSHIDVKDKHCIGDIDGLIMKMNDIEKKLLSNKQNKLVDTVLKLIDGYYYLNKNISPWDSEFDYHKTYTWYTKFYDYYKKIQNIMDVNDERVINIFRKLIVKILNIKISLINCANQYNYHKHMLYSLYEIVPKGELKKEIYNTILYEDTKGTGYTDDIFLLMHDVINYTDDYNLIRKVLSNASTYTLMGNGIIYYGISDNKIYCIGNNIRYIDILFEKASPEIKKIIKIVTTSAKNLRLLRMHKKVDYLKILKKFNDDTLITKFNYWYQYQEEEGVLNETLFEALPYEIVKLDKVFTAF